MLLVLAFLGFGVLLGNVAGSPVSGTLAASSRRLKVVLAQPAPASIDTSKSTSAPSEEPPASEPEATPSPATPETTSKTATSKQSTSSGSSSSTAGEGESGESSAAGPAAKLPPIRHVFVIVLSNEPYAAVFGPASAAHYLSQTLEARGELLVRYDAVAHEQLANGAALISGQGPTAETAADCPTYTDVAPATGAADEQVLGNGCVYPAATQTLAGQLAAKHLSWRAYVEGMGEAPGQSPACAHPALGQSDPTATPPPAGEAYATFRNPFVYFHSVIDSPSCATADVGLDKLKSDLSAARRTPSFSYIVPDRCHDASPTPCAPGAPAGLAPADAFLKKIVPEIMGSAAYRQGGLLAITVDEAPSSGEFADSSSCCGQPRFPNLGPPPSGLSPRGGGTVGALLLSRYVKGATTNQEPFNHFSLLRTVEDLFGLKHLGYAALAAVKPFEPSMFTAKPSG